LKVAINVLSQSPRHSTGALSWFLQFAQAAPRLDLATDYVLFAGKADVSYYQSKAAGMVVRGLGSGNSRRALRVLTEHLLLGAKLKSEKIDILFQGGSGVAPLLLPRDVKLVLAIWGMQHVSERDIRWEQRLYRRLLFRPGLRRADRIVVNSAYTRDLLLVHYGRDIRAPIDVVHHGVDLALFHADPDHVGQRKDLPPESGTPYVLFVGQIYPYKLLHVLAEALCRAISRGSLPHTLVVVGNFASSDSMGMDYRQQIQRIFSDAGLGDRLVLAQDVKVKDLRALYAGAALYVQSSAAETFGRTVIEAMACGAPVLAARAGATPEILGDCGRYYEALDVEDCAAQILAILQDKNLRRDLIARGLERAKIFSHEGEVKALVALFHRLHSGQA